MKPRILVCLDSDPQPSVFDSVVAVDAGVDHLFRHAGVTPSAVRELVYGAMFTRGADDLKSTALFIGGGDVELGSELLKATTACFFGPMRVSVLLDSNGANTTAAATVVAAGRHINLSKSTIAVLAGTGSVGKRVVRMLASEGATVRVGSRKLAHGNAVVALIKASHPDANITAHEVAAPSQLEAMLAGADAVIACGPPGIELLGAELRKATPTLRVAIDLNAVPPLGLAGIEVHHKAVEQAGCICYGAIGVGGTKMKIHRTAIERLFMTNDAVLDADEVYAIGKQIG